MPQIQYAFRDDAKTIAMLTQGCTAACPLSQIVALRKREITPEFLDNYMVMDVKGTNFPASALTDYGRGLSFPTHHRKYIAIIDSQIEFTVKSRTMHKLSEFLPAYTGTSLYNFFEGQPYGYLVVLKVYAISQEIPDALLSKGRLGSAQIMALYDDFGEKQSHTITNDLVPVIDDGSFEYIKYEILHTLRVENSLIGVYGTDEDSRRLLRQKRDDYNESKGQYKRTFNEEDDVDRAQVDYDAIYRKVISIAPGLKEFINYVREIKPPQLVEWQAMMSKAGKGDVSAKHRIIEMYLRNVIRYALYYAEKYDLPLEDTIQDGIVGLHNAVEKFDPTENYTFQQYYPLWIRQSIQREMPRYMYTRYLPIHIHEQLLNIKELGMQNGLILPDDYAIVTEDFISLVSDKLDVSIDTARKYLQYFVPEISLDDYIDTCEFENEDIDASLVYDAESDLIDYLQSKNLRGVLNKVLHTLTPREKHTLQMRYGFIDGRPRTLEELGRMYNVSRERIRQLETKAIRKLRHPKKSHVLKEYLV